MASKNRSISANLELGAKMYAGIITPVKGKFINKDMAVKKMKSL